MMYFRMTNQKYFSLRNEKQLSFRRGTDLDVGSILWSAGHVMLFLQHLKLKAKVVNGNGVLAGIVLQNTYEHSNWLVRLDMLSLKIEI